MGSTKRSGAGWRGTHGAPARHSWRSYDACVCGTGRAMVHACACLLRSWAHTATTRAGPLHTPGACRRRVRRRWQLVLRGWWQRQLPAATRGRSFGAKRGGRRKVRAPPAHTASSSRPRPQLVVQDLPTTKNGISRASRFPEGGGDPQRPLPLPPLAPPPPPRTCSGFRPAPLMGTCCACPGRACARPAAPGCSEGSGGAGRTRRGAVSRKTCYTGTATDTQ